MTVDFDKVFETITKQIRRYNVQDWDFNALGIFVDQIQDFFNFGILNCCERICADSGIDVFFTIPSENQCKFFFSLKIEGIR